MAQKCYIYDTIFKQVIYILLPNYIEKKHPLRYIRRKIYCPKQIILCYLATNAIIHLYKLFEGLLLLYFYQKI